MPSTIRLARPDDAERLAALYAPHVLERPTSFELHAPDGAEMAHRVAEVQRAWPWLVWEDGSGVQAYAYASPHAERPAYRWSVNVSVYVALDRARQGIGRALYARLFEILRAQGACSVFAGITLPNAGSVGLHQAMGFEWVGVFRRAGYKLGAWHDVAWLGRTLHEPAPGTEPPPPRPLPQLLAEGRFVEPLTSAP